MVLSGGRSSRLYQSLVLEQKVATSVATYITPGSRYDNLFVLSAVPRPPHSLEALEKAIYEELNRLTTEVVSSEELERARNQLATDQLRGLRDNGRLARMLTFYQSVSGDWRYVVTYDKNVAEITGDDIRRTAERYLKPTNRTVITLSRQEEG